MKYYFPHTDVCFVCGEGNPIGLNLKAYYEDGKIMTEFFTRPNLAGYKDAIHGGIITTVIDEVMTWCAFTYGSLNRMYLTREIDIKFKRRVCINKYYFAIAEFVQEKKILVYVRGTLEDKNRNIYAIANAAFAPFSEKDSEEGILNAKFENDKLYHTKILRLYNQLNIDKH